MKIVYVKLYNKVYAKDDILIEDTFNIDEHSLRFLEMFRFIESFTVRYEQILHISQVQCKFYIIRPLHLPYHLNTIPRSFFVDVCVCVCNFAPAIIVVKCNDYYATQIQFVCV